MPALLTRPVRLTIDEYRLAWAAADLSTVHWNLSPPGTAPRKSAESERIRAVARDGLRRKGLADEAGVSEDLLDALGLIARSATEINAQINDGTVPSIRLVSAAQPRLAVLAVLNEDELELRPVSPDEFVTATAVQIAAAPAAPGRPVTVPADALAPGSPLPPDRLDRRLADAGMPRHEIAQLHDLADGPKLAAATIGVARGGIGAQRRDGDLSLSYVQTQRGGIAFHYHRGADSRLLCTVAPADSSGLARLITELLGTVR